MDSRIASDYSHVETVVSQPIRDDPLCVSELNPRDATGCRPVRSSRTTRMRLRRHIPLDEERQTTLESDLHTEKSPAQDEPVRAGSGHGYRREIKPFGEGSNNGGPETETRPRARQRMCRDPSPERAPLGLTLIDHRHQLQVIATKGNETIGGAVAGMPAAFHRIQSVFIEQLSGGGLEIGDGQYHMVKTEHYHDATPRTKANRRQPARMS